MHDRCRDFTISAATSRPAPFAGTSGRQTCYRLAAMSDDPRGLERLYPRLLGAAWARLDPAVQRVHTSYGTIAGPVRATGTFEVRRAPGRPIGLMLDLAGGPLAADAAPVQLAIAHRMTRRGPVERWHRVFGGRPLVTRQSEAPGGLLAERIGLLEFRFRLAAEDGALLFEQESCQVGLGRYRLRLPGWLSPAIWCREQTAHDLADGPDQTSVFVKVTAPGGGLVFSYRGTVHWDRG